MTTLYLALSVISLPTLALTSPSTYTVVWVKSEDNLRLRAGLATTYKILKNIPFNAINVKNLGSRTSSGWCKVQYLGVQGWSACKYLGESNGFDSVLLSSALSNT